MQYEKLRRIRQKALTSRKKMPKPTNELKSTPWKRRVGPNILIILLFIDSDMVDLPDPDKPVIQKTIPHLFLLYFTMILG